MLPRISQRGITRSLALLSRRACPLRFAVSPTRFDAHTQQAQRWLTNFPTPNRDAFVPTKKGNKSSWISTLDPSKISVKDILDISGILRLWVSLKGIPGSACGITYKSHGSASRGEHHYFPFPPNSKGIFYFHDRSSIHPVAGGIRFRVLPVDSVKGGTSIDTADLFARGHDLVDHACHGPWHISLLSIIYRRCMQFYDFMKVNGHITDAAEIQVQRLEPASTSRGPSLVGIGGCIVEQITDPFILDLSKKDEPMIFLQEEGIKSWSFQTRFATTIRPKCRVHGKNIYSGTILVRLEMIRQGSHNRVAMRALKFLKPPNPGDPVVQEEGKLLKRYDPTNKIEQPWMAMRTPKYITPPSLKLLEETYIPRILVDSHRDARDTYRPFEAAV